MVNNAVEIKMYAKGKAKTMVDEGQKAGELRKVDDGQSKVKGHKAVTLKDVGLTKQEISSWKPFAVPEKELEKAITIVKQRDGVLTEINF